MLSRVCTISRDAWRLPLFGHVQFLFVSILISSRKSSVRESGRWWLVATNMDLQGTCMKQRILIAVVFSRGGVHGFTWIARMWRLRDHFHLCAEASRSNGTSEKIGWSDVEKRYNIVYVICWTVVTAEWMINGILDYKLLLTLFRGINDALCLSVMNPCRVYGPLDYASPVGAKWIPPHLTFSGKRWWWQ